MKPEHTRTRRPGNEALKDFTLLVLIFAAVSLGLLLWIKYGATPPSTGGLPPGKPAPAIAALGWLNGNPPTPRDLAGKVMVVDAWATWCLPCRIEAPNLVRLYNKYQDRGVVFIGLTDEGPESLKGVKAFLQETGIEWLNGYGAVETLTALEADHLPGLWVIGPDGTITWNFDSPESIEEAIEGALAAAKRS